MKRRRILEVGSQNDGFWVESSRAALPLDGVKLAEHRRNVLIRFRVGTKLHPIANDAGQVISDLLIRCANFKHL